MKTTFISHIKQMIHINFAYHKKVNLKGHDNIKLISTMTDYLHKMSLMSLKVTNVEFT